MQGRGEKLELQYRKLLQEYNAILISLFSVPLGMMGLALSMTKNITITFLFGGVVYLFINSIKEDKSRELNDKIQEIA